MTDITISISILNPKSANSNSTPINILPGNFNQNIPKNLYLTIKQNLYLITTTTLEFIGYQYGGQWPLWQEKSQKDPSKRWTVSIGNPISNSKTWFIGRGCANVFRDKQFLYSPEDPYYPVTNDMGLNICAGKNDSSGCMLACDLDPTPQYLSCSQTKPGPYLPGSDCWNSPHYCSSTAGGGSECSYINPTKEPFISYPSPSPAPGDIYTKDGKKCIFPWTPVKGQTISKCYNSALGPYCATAPGQGVNSPGTFVQSPSGENWGYCDIACSGESNENKWCNKIEPSNSNMFAYATLPSPASSPSPSPSPSSQSPSPASSDTESTGVMFYDGKGTYGAISIENFYKNCTSSTQKNYSDTSIWENVCGNLLNHIYIISLLRTDNYKDLYKNIQTFHEKNNQPLFLTIYSKNLSPETGLILSMGINVLQSKHTLDVIVYFPTSTNLKSLLNIINMSVMYSKDLGKTITEKVEDLGSPDITPVQGWMTGSNNVDNLNCIYNDCSSQPLTYANMLKNYSSTVGNSNYPFLNAIVAPYDFSKNKSLVFKFNQPNYLPSLLATGGQNTKLTQSQIDLLNETYIDKGMQGVLDDMYTICDRVKQGIHNNDANNLICGSNKTCKPNCEKLTGWKSFSGKLGDPCKKDQDCKEGKCLDNTCLIKVQSEHSKKLKPWLMPVIIGGSVLVIIIIVLSVIFIKKHQRKINNN